MKAFANVKAATSFDSTALIIIDGEDPLRNHDVQNDAKAIHRVFRRSLPTRMLDLLLRELLMSYASKHSDVGDEVATIVNHIQPMKIDTKV